MRLKTWFLETRPQFLLLPVVLSILGTSMAAYEGSINWGYAVLAFVGLLLAHMSVNILNDYFDFKSGVDLETRQTPFSGGSGILPAGEMTPKQVLWFGSVCFALILPIGIFFTVAVGWQLLPLLFIGALCILLYTPLILKRTWPEWSPGLGLGILPVLGTYFVQTGSYSISAVIAAIPSGILVHNLLLLNEFPDIQADMTVRRKTLPITAGAGRAARVYSIATVSVYVWIIGAVIAGHMPVFCLISLVTLPVAIRAIRGSVHSDQIDRFLPALGSSVLVVLATQLLLGVGFAVAEVL